MNELRLYLLPCNCLELGSPRLPFILMIPTGRAGPQVYDMGHHSSEIDCAFHGLGLSDAKWM